MRRRAPEAQVVKGLSGASALQPRPSSCGPAFDYAGGRGGEGYTPCSFFWPVVSTAGSLLSSLIRLAFSAFLLTAFGRLAVSAPFVGTLPG